jgi:serine/threonine protein kinase
MLRQGLAGGVESGESSFEEAVKPKSELLAHRFENYELAKGDDGTPIELGRGAMGVTLREARAAASVRHPNVASVLHLGRTGNSYFYTMEFVEGETLEHLIRRSGRVEVKLALEIATQVAAGLAAVHEQNLVHRDIKPTNIRAQTNF